MKEIKLRNGQVCLVDDEDFERVNQYKWGVDKKGYARRTQKINRKSIGCQMHRFIMRVDGKKVPIVDHINRNVLDNRKENLRFCTANQNQWNRVGDQGSVSGMKGVSFFRPTKKWRARVNANRKCYNLGYFETKEEAFAVCCEFRMKIHGIFVNNGIIKEN